MKALLACALIAIAVTTARAVPFVPTNTPEQARQWMYCDSIIVRGKDQLGNPASNYDKVKRIALFAIDAGSARGQTDSILIAWYNGGATPRFRRIQGMHIFMETQGPGAPQTMILDIFHPDGTSANNKVIFNNELDMEIPLEADSIHVTTNVADGTPRDFCICVW